MGVTSARTEDPLEGCVSATDSAKVVVLRVSGLIGRSAVEL